MSTSVAPPKSIADIPGWFTWTDQQIFGAILSADIPRGDLVELGVYFGKSAAWMGSFLREGERLTVIDLFNEVGTDNANQAELDHSYGTLTRVIFEENYRAIVGGVPTVITGPSSEIVHHVEAGTVRFLHIDASHHYHHVVVDIESAEHLLQSGGVVACDDYRSPHTPGVSAAVWGAVVEGRLRPICITPSKLYGTFSDPSEFRQLITEYVESSGKFLHETHNVAGQPLVRIWPKPVPVDPTGPIDTPKELQGVLKRVKALERRVADVERIAATERRHGFATRASRRVGAAAKRGLARIKKAR
jgi:hypothetical protein